MADFLTFPQVRRKRGEVASYPLAVARMWVALGRLPNRMDGRNFDRDWDAMQDDDGAICLVPCKTLEPPFAIIPEDGGYLVLVCEVDDTDELGPFPTLEAALEGIRAWLALPQAAWR